MFHINEEWILRRELKNIIGALIYLGLTRQSHLMSRLQTPFAFPPRPMFHFYIQCCAIAAANKNRKPSVTLTI